MAYIVFYLCQVVLQGGEISYEGGGNLSNKLIINSCNFIFKLLSYMLGFSSAPRASIEFPFPSSIAKASS